MKYIIEYFFELNPFDDDSLSTSVTERQLILEANDINEAEKIGRSLIDTLVTLLPIHMLLLNFPVTSTKI